MRISVLLYCIGFFSQGVTIVNGQPSQMLLPLKKAVARKFISPEPKTGFLLSIPDSAKTIVPSYFLPLNFYSAHIGVMCKMELKLEKRTKLPLRIRLGSKDQVDYLEGKKSQ